MLLIEKYCRFVSRWHTQTQTIIFAKEMWEAFMRRWIFLLKVIDGGVTTYYLEKCMSVFV